MSKCKCKCKCCAKAYAEKRSKVGKLLLQKMDVIYLLEGDLRAAWDAVGDLCTRPANSLPDAITNLREQILKLSDINVALVEALHLAEAVRDGERLRADRAIAERCAVEEDLATFKAGQAEAQR